MALTGQFNMFPLVAMPEQYPAQRSHPIIMEIPELAITILAAYEVQYSRWNGTANDNLWTNLSNWDGNIDPSSGLDYVIIPTGLAHYPTASSPDFTLGSGKIMILQPEHRLPLVRSQITEPLNFNVMRPNMSSLICSSRNRYR